MRKVTIIALTLLGLLSGPSYAFDFAGIFNMVSGETSINHGRNSIVFKNLASRAPDYEVNFRLPLYRMNKYLKSLGVGELSTVRVVNPDIDPVTSDGRNIVITNLLVDWNGIEIQPTITLALSMPQYNKVVVRIVGTPHVHVDVDTDQDLTQAPAAGATAPGKPYSDRDGQIVDMLAKVATKIYSAINADFRRARQLVKAEEIFSVSPYDSRTKSITLTLNPGFISKIMQGTVDEIHLTSLKIDKNGISLRLKPEPSQPDTDLKGYDLMITDGLFTEFMQALATDTDYDLLPQDCIGGIRFKDDNRVKLGIKVRNMVSLAGRPDSCSLYDLRGEFADNNTLVLYAEDETITQAYKVPVPDFVNERLKASVIYRVARAIAAKEPIKQYFDMQPIGYNGLKMTILLEKFLPHYFDGLQIQRLKIEDGRILFGFGPVDETN